MTSLGGPIAVRIESELAYSSPPPPTPIPPSRVVDDVRDSAAAQSAERSGDETGFEVAEAAGPDTPRSSGKHCNVHDMWTCNK